MADLVHLDAGGDAAADGLLGAGAVGAVDDEGRALIRFRFRQVL